MSAGHARENTVSTKQPLEKVREWNEMSILVFHYKFAYEMIKCALHRRVTDAGRKLRENKREHLCAYVHVHHQQT